MFYFFIGPGALRRPELKIYFFLEAKSLLILFTA